MRTNLVWLKSSSLADVEHRKQEIYFFEKRFFDIIFSSLALLVCLPLMMGIAIAILLDSAGPIVFIQERVGSRRKSQNGHACWERDNFRCFKFRTMRHHSDPGLHQAYIQAYISKDEDAMARIQNGDTKEKKLCNDPRVTRVGRFLRKTSLDELPQFLNVLLGNMSVVGPRPPIPYEVNLYEPWQMQRLDAIPGITGLWQVSARSQVDFDEMVRIDLNYIRKQSFLFDFQIILKTPLAMFSCKGAH